MSWSAEIFLNEIRERRRQKEIERQQYCAAPAYRNPLADPRFVPVNLPFVKPRLSGTDFDLVETPTEEASHVS